MLQIKKFDQIEQSVHSQEVQASPKIQQQNHPLNAIWGEFAGDLYIWHKFKNQFKAAVHDNAKLTDPEKLVYLKQSCKSTALMVIQEANKSYQDAWEKLNDVFGEAYAQLHYCIHRLSNIPSVVNATANSLKNLMNNGDNCTKILKEIAQSDKFEAIVAIMIANKLDQDTMRAWDRHRSVLAAS